MAELAFLPGPPILQVAGLKFLSRNEAMRSLLGHLGKDSFQTFRGFKPPLVCPLVGKRKEAGCALPAGCIARDSPCYLRKVTKAAVDGGFPVVTPNTIITRLTRLQADYKTALKNQRTMSEEKVAAYMANMDETFDIFKKDWHAELENDGSISEEERARKVEVMRDYMEEGGTKSLAVLPEVVTPEVLEDRREMARLQEERKKRQAKELERRRRERGEGEGSQVEENRARERERSPLRGSLRGGRRRREGGGQDGGEGEEGQEGQVGEEGDGGGCSKDPDYDPGDVQDEEILGRVPLNILELTTAVAVAEGLSVRSHVMMIIACLIAQG